MFTVLIVKLWYMLKFSSLVIIATSYIEFHTPTAIITQIQQMYRYAPSCHLLPAVYPFHTLSGNHTNLEILRTFFALLYNGGHNFQIVTTIIQQVKECPQVQQALQ